MAGGAKLNFLPSDILSKQMIKLTECELVTGSKMGANVTQIILDPAGEHCPFVMDYCELYYEQPWLNQEDALKKEKKTKT